MRALYIPAIFILAVCSFSCKKENVTYPTAAAADFSIAKEEFAITEEIELTDTSVPENGNQVTAWEWDFGTPDLPKSSLQNPKITYTVENTYKITLTITDNNGLKSTVSKDVNVVDPANNVRIVWSQPLAESIQNTVSPAMSPDEKTVYMIADRADANGPLELFAYDAASGNVNWKFNVDQAMLNLNAGGNPRLVYCSPSVGEDGTIYIAVRDLQSPATGRKSFLFAINASNGNSKWTYPFGYDANFNYITPAIGPDGNIYAGGLTNQPFKIAVLNPSNGAEIRSIALSAGVRSGMALSKTGDVYFASTGANGVFGYNSITTTQSFNHVPAGLSSTGGAFSIGSDGTVYTTSTIGSNGGVHAITPNGSEKWTYKTTGAIDFGGVAIGADGTLYAPGGRAVGTPAKSDGLVALNADGSLKWKFETTEAVTNSVPLVDNRGYVHFVTDNGTYYVVKNDGSVFGSLSLGIRSWSSPVMDARGMVYIAAERTLGVSEMVSINTRASGPANSAWPMKGQNSRRTHLQK